MAERRGKGNMKYQKYMQEIMEQLTEYKTKVDEIAISYVSEKQKHEKQLENMDGKYTESYMAEERRNWKPKINYRGLIDFAREVHQKNAMDYFDKIKSEMDGYFQIPVDSGFASTVSAIKAVGVTLNDREFKLLQGASGGYWGRRLLNELAVSRTKTEQGAELENGEMKRTEKETKIPYGGVELPDIEKAYDSLQGVQNALNMAFEGYCGENYELKNIVFPLSKATEETNTSLVETYGVQPHKQTLDNLTISKMASSTKCFDEKYHSYTAFSEMMRSLEATMPKPKRKEVLTDDDKKLIDMIINSNYPTLAQDEAVNIAKADEHLAELLALDERYGAAVKTALGEVSENE